MTNLQIHAEREWTFYIYVNGTKILEMVVNGLAKSEEVVPDGNTCPMSCLLTKTHWFSLLGSLPLSWEEEALVTLVRQPQIVLSCVWIEIQRLVVWSSQLVKQVSDHLHIIGWKSRTKAHSIVRPVDKDNKLLRWAQEGCSLPTKLDST